MVADAAEPLPSFDEKGFGRLFDRWADRRVILLGEASHVTSDFYRARAAITRHLVKHHGFTVIAAEADWPDAAAIDRYVSHHGGGRMKDPPFQRFPTWMWRNTDVLELMKWLRAHNEPIEQMDDGESFLDAAQNARLISSAERYYRIMYYGGAESWNLRDSHMFETLANLLEAKSDDAKGDDAKAIVWAHNSHIGDARYTEMGQVRGEHNIGQLCRQKWGDEVTLIGFGTNTGTVAAASGWDGGMEIKRVLVRAAPENCWYRTNGGLPTMASNFWRSSKSKKSDTVTDASSPASCKSERAAMAESS